MADSVIQSNAGDIYAASSNSLWKRRLWTIAATLILVGAGAAAYSSSFDGVFIFDDERAILQNQRIHQIKPIWDLKAERLSTRPLVDLSLKVNYRFADKYADPAYPKVRQVPDIFYFHVFNLAVHILTGLTLFGIIRRTLRTQLLRESLGKYADVLALAVAAIWLTHPLNTSAVTYIIQRGESMMGLFYLLTVYCAIRSFNSRRQIFWAAGAVLACLAGIGCKQVIVTAPVMVLIYDWVFISNGKFTDLRKRRSIHLWVFISNGKFTDLRKRWPIHLSLFLTWVPLIAMSFTTITSNATAGFAAKDVGPLGYGFTQFGVILHYLKLTFWPAGLCMDYMWPKAESISEILIPAIPIVGAIAITVWALKNKPALGFLGAWFFLVLAPSSSIMPINDLAFEHRMYVPLMGVIALVVIGGFMLIQRLLTARAWKHAAGVYAVVVILCIAAAGALGAATYERNKVFSDRVIAWADVAIKRPQNWRAHFNLGNRLAAIKQNKLAEARYLKAIEIKPDYAEAQYNLANLLRDRGRTDEAITYYKLAISNRQTLPSESYASNIYNNLGILLSGRGELDEAIYCYQQAMEVHPESPQPYNNIGIIFEQQGKLDEAITYFRKAIELQPFYGQARYNLAKANKKRKASDSQPQNKGDATWQANFCLDAGKTLAGQGKPEEAIASFKKALEYDPKLVKAHKLWGDELAKMGDFEGQVEHYKIGLAAKDEDFRKSELVRIQLAAGKSLLEASKTGDAETAYHKALEMDPGNNKAKFGLAQIFAKQGKVNEAIEACPQTADKLFELGRSFQKYKNTDGAIAAYKRTIELKSDHVNAYNSLALLYYRKQQFADAAELFETALKIEPDNIPVKRNLAGIYAYCPDLSVRNGEKAVALGEQVCQASQYKNPIHVNVLAAAYAQAGDFEKAIAMSEKAIALANKKNQSHLADQFRKRLELYKSGKAVPGKTLR